MYKSNYKPGFTMAEVLITIGLIGLIAAMTLPEIIANAQKESTAAYLKKFYNTMNNAIQFSVAKNGDVEYWMGEAKENTYEENLQFLQLYLLPYIKYNKYDNCYKKWVCVYMQTGGMFTFRYDVNGGDITYVPSGKTEILNNRTTRNCFLFQFNKIEGYNDDGTPIKRINRKTSIEPYAFGWDSSYEHLKSHPRYGCRKDNEIGAFCTKLIQMNNWKITDDYPW